MNWWRTKTEKRTRSPKRPSSVWEWSRWSRSCTRAEPSWSSYRNNWTSPRDCRGPQRATTKTWGNRSVCPNTHRDDICLLFLSTHAGFLFKLQRPALVFYMGSYKWSWMGLWKLLFLSFYRKHFPPDDMRYSFIHLEGNYCSQAAWYAITLIHSLFLLWNIMCHGTAVKYWGVSLRKLFSRGGKPPRSNTSLETLVCRSQPNYSITNSHTHNHNLLCEVESVLLFSTG